MIGYGGHFGLRRDKNGLPEKTNSNSKPPKKNGNNSKPPKKMGIRNPHDILSQVIGWPF
jgi:hypothetical protein